MQHPRLLLAGLPLLLGAAGCDDASFSWPAPVTPDPRYAEIVPFRAGHLVPREDLSWLEYEDAAGLGTALRRLRGLGARQVVIPAPYTFTAEARTDKVYDGFATANVILRDGLPPGAPSDQRGPCQRGDMGLAPAAIPAGWVLRSVHRDLPANEPALNFPGPFAAPLAPAQLFVTFAPGWDGGDILIEGISAAGAQVRETVPALPGAPPLRTVNTYRAISAAFKTRTGASPATVSLGADLTLAAAQARAELVLLRVMEAARREGLRPVLLSRPTTTPAHPSECAPCLSDGDCYVQDWPAGSRCAKDHPQDAAGICRAFPGSVPYVDPSRDTSPGFDQFFAGQRAHITALSALSARGGAVLLGIGGGSPYLTGAGQSIFADNSPMEARRAALTAGWRGVIAAARAVPGRPLLTYAAQNLFVEGRLRMQPTRPEWDRVDFWGDLDVVGIDFFQPGRPGVLSEVDRSERSVQDMIRYMETRGVDSDQVFGSLRDLEGLARRAGFSVRERPVLLLTDGVAAAPYGAAQSQITPASPGDAADFVEQQRFIEARLTVVGTHVQRGWLGGIGLWPFQAGVSGASPSYGGAAKASTVGMDKGFTLTLDYYALFDTPAEATIKKHFGPVE